MNEPKKNISKSADRKNNSWKDTSKLNSSGMKVDNVKVSFFSKTRKRIEAFFGKIRDWLNLNKVFFETLAATTLTIMAVTLARSQLKVAREQTEYLQQQIFIQRAQTMPQIIVTQEGVDSMTEMAEEKIFIYNQGNIARDIDVMSRCTLVIFTTDGLRKTIPIADYYGEPEFTQNSTGLLATINNEKMFAKVVEIENEIRHLSWKDNGIRDFGISRNIMVYYTDIFGGSHREFFYINPVFGAQLSDESVERDYFDGFGSMPNFTSITVDDILNYINHK
jgi:hypothetical protein